MAPGHSVKFMIFHSVRVFQSTCNAATGLHEQQFQLARLRLKASPDTAASTGSLRCEAPATTDFAVLPAQLHLG